MLCDPRRITADLTLERLEVTTSQAHSIANLRLY